MVAVLTADIVNSTKYNASKIKSWQEETIKICHQNLDFSWILKPEIFRGDSFQGVLKNPDEALQAALLMRTCMRRYDSDIDLRVAIGIGAAEHLSDRPGTSDGEAFRLSGHLADRIREQKSRIGIALSVPSEPLNASLSLLEAIVSGYTTTQSEIVMYLLQGKSITQIAEELPVTQSAISQRAASAKWWAIENFLVTFPENLKLYTRNYD